MDKFIKIISPEADFPVKKAVIALGVFDGVHNGHRLVVKAAVELAKRLKCNSGAVTFMPHPRQVLCPGNSPALLIPEDERIRRLLSAGADFAARINFNAAIARWDAEEFLENLTRCGIFELAGICVGSNWRFGKNGSGSSAELKKFCDKRNIAFVPVPEVEDNGEVISSTRIRELIAAGELVRAKEISGYFPQLSGRVGHGFKVAGKELKAPTANLDVQYGVLPPDGVYAGFSRIGGEIFPAVLNIGAAPTYNITEKRIEIHLIGFNGALYGESLTVSLVKKLRDIRKFETPEELKSQIITDINSTVGTIARCCPV